MWFITEFLERTARSFAQTIVKVAMMEADAQLKAAAAARARRALANGLILPERALCVPATIALEPRVLVLPEAPPEPQHALRELVEAAEAKEAATAAIERAAPGDVLAAIAQTQDGVHARLEEPLTAAVDLSARPVPMGVRGDVVVRWVALFAAAAGGAENATLIEKLRKDKKVRVPELQLIVAGIVGGPVVHRKKGEHLEALRRHLVPADRRRAAGSHEAAAWL